MKKIYLSILSVLTAVTLNAQLTQANHAPTAGDTYQTYQCDSVSPGSAGSNVIWNFSATTTHSSIISTFLASASTNTNYASATVSVSSGGNNWFYNSSATTLNYYGGSISLPSPLGTINGSLTYTSPAVYAAYPMSLGSTSSATIGGDMNVTTPFPVAGTFTGTNTVLADGTGTLISAAGTFTDVIRVLTTQYINFSAGTNGTIIQANYEYYSAGTKAPIFSIATATFNVGGSPTTQTIVTRNKNAVGTLTVVAPPTNTVVTPPTNTVTTGVSENTSKGINVQVFPNPATSNVNFVTDSPDANHVLVYDITGKLIDKVLLNDGKVKLDVSDYNNGLYIYRIVSDNNKIQKTGKITIGN